MTRIAFRGITREHLFVVVIILLISALCLLPTVDPAHGAEQAAVKPYNPFDEPTPKVSQVILDDARLDVHVKVFAKSWNFKDLFAELSRVTGVRLTVAPELSAERAIVYMHDRPLRDVMTEVSGLFGYYWLVKGTEGSRSYELFEDIRHAQRRDGARDEETERLASLVLSLAGEVRAGRGKWLDTIRQTDQESYAWLTSAVGREFAGLIGKLDQQFVRQVLAGQTTDSFAEFPSAYQTAILDWANEHFKWTFDSERREWTEKPLVSTLTMADIAEWGPRFRRVRGHVFDIPRFTIQNKYGNQLATFPPWGLEKAEVWAAAGERSPGRVIGDPLPDEPKISLTKLRWIPYGDNVILGDMLEAIASRSKFDLVADYYYQKQNLTTFEDEPLSRVVRDVCDRCAYTCQVEGGMLRFRSNDWFIQPLRPEPSAKLLDRLWKDIEKDGILGFEQILDVGTLPDGPLQWPGFRMIPGADEVRNVPRTMALLKAILPALYIARNAADGIPIPELEIGQQEKLLEWAKLTNAGVLMEDLAHSVLTFAYDTQLSTYDMKLKHPDRLLAWSGIAVPKPLSEELRKRVANQRRADREADKVEMRVRD